DYIDVFDLQYAVQDARPRSRRSHGTLTALREAPMVPEPPRARRAHSRTREIFQSGTEAAPTTSIPILSNLDERRVNVRCLYRVVLKAHRLLTGRTTRWRGGSPVPPPLRAANRAVRRRSRVLPASLRLRWRGVDGSV